MPSRKDVFHNNCYYHIFDKTIDHKEIFSLSKFARHFIQTFLYYRSKKSILRFSKMKLLDRYKQNDIWNEIMLQNYFQVDIVSYCLMPNHYHFLLKQLKENGIRIFMSQILNSITRYYNVLNKRKGPVFLTQFRSKKIYTVEQLVYVSRYIHTNPYADSLVGSIEEIFNYSYSSIGSYLTNVNKCKIAIDDVLDYFGNKPEKYKDFIIKNADDQKDFEYLKYSEKWRI
ncbi:MAG: transposase [bacterium]|nr:transposase [bacterium]